MLFFAGGDEIERNAPQKFFCLTFGVQFKEGQCSSSIVMVCYFLVLIGVSSGNPYQF